MNTASHSSKNRIAQWLKEGCVVTHLEPRWVVWSRRLVLVAAVVAIALNTYAMVRLVETNEQLIKTNRDFAAVLALRAPRETTHEQVHRQGDEGSDETPSRFSPSGTRSAR